MGKKQHQKDKLYLTATEWATEWGGRRANSRKMNTNDPDFKDFRRLPFDHCALSLQPYGNPYCDEDGNIFDLVHIVPYLKKYKSNPVTGKKLEAEMLTKLKIHKNSKGEIHCPVLFKVFNNNTDIACIKTTGNVFSYEAIKELNLKTKNFKDLLTDEPFARKDIIVLQDPQNTDKFNLNSFHHVKNKLKLEDDELERAKSDPRARLKRMNNETKEALKELDASYVSKEEAKKEENAKADKFNAAPYSTGKVAASFTSTAMTRETVHEAAVLEEDIVRYERVKKKGYVRLVTNVGALNLELHCEYVPKTCENFMKLCQKGYYDGTKFHRSIKHFMIQGGDPTGTGTGGESYWGKNPFKDEFKQHLSHAGRGILSMANSGPNTNKSQFFITYRSCKHLDGKHTVFGRLVGGMETLSALERVNTDNKDRPIEDLIIERTVVFVDPFKEADEELAKERQLEIEKKKEEESHLKQKKELQPQKKAYSKGIGKFINPTLVKDTRKAINESKGEPSKKKKKSGYSFSDFNSW